MIIFFGSLKEDLFTIYKTNANDSNIIVTLASFALCHIMVMIRENSWGGH